ncbi:uncharacterized protein J7T54_007778 [Emericellopsis cladophorae]|uniref:beta-glucosidase n=1 Tax=Emericellopsis cladophorae TaxID=2686198 RepID=A0A9P9XX24_9HYPO|nr:uncharacterized protein J7T54_007778 [Emericellopsis cladophorae]KAI6779251.1 hypothetical protein J7T54_007778 [Emericellopsis cladophorae]
MSLEEKAGQMFQQVLLMRPGGVIDTGNPDANRLPTESMIKDRYISHYNLAGGNEEGLVMAGFMNHLQELALETRLGIPITISTDPRNSFTENFGTGFSAGTFSEWPEVAGLAALRDPELVFKYAEIIREEYLAVGIRSALHPTVDVSTEPRWARNKGTMGEDAHLIAELVVPMLKGLQGDVLGPRSLTTVTKHFPGGGAMQDGEDAHFWYGKNATYPGDNFDYHLIPFRAAFEAGARQIMPYYSRPIDTEYEEVGWAFNKAVITDLLREEMGFRGIVVADWGIISNQSMGDPEPAPARAWGVEHLSRPQRLLKALEAGVDQFGGEHVTDILIDLVKSGIVPETRIDRSVRAILREKFILGLFEQPFVDVEAAQRIVGNDYFRRVGAETQRRSYTLLTNKENILPLRRADMDAKFYIEGFNKTYMELRNLTVVETPQEADVALLKFEAPSYPRSGAFEKSFNTGPLNFTMTEQERQAAIYAAVPTIVDVWLSRPAVIPEVFERAAAVMGSYGSSPEAFLDLVFGDAKPEGKLPFDLPSSMEDVENQFEDVPFDTENPVFRFGHGLSYENVPCKNRCAKR